jgi:ribosomal protein S18 acetylase RimI-like enzyme
MSVSVRPGVAGDRDALEAAIRSDATFRADEIDVALELVDAGLAGSSDYAIRVAELAGEGGGGARVVGYLCFGPTPMTRASYDLYWIVVHADARGRGVAGALLRAMEAELASRGGGNIRVETSETEGYGAARALYERHGYPEAARLADFYSPGDALIVYYKRVAATA